MSGRWRDPRSHPAITHKLGVRFNREMERLLRETSGDPERLRKFGLSARKHFSRNFPCTVIFLENPD